MSFTKSQIRVTKIRDLVVLLTATFLGEMILKKILSEIKKFSNILESTHFEPFPQNVANAKFLANSHRIGEMVMEKSWEKKCKVHGNPDFRGRLCDCKSDHLLAMFFLYQYIHTL